MPAKDILAQVAAELEKQIEAKVAELKKKHNLREVYVLRVVDVPPIVDLSGKSDPVPPIVKLAYLKPVTRQTLAAAGAVAGSDSYKYSAIIMRDCWLDGDMDIQENDTLFLNAMRQLDALLEWKEAEIKKY